MKYLIFAYNQYYPSGAYYELKAYKDTLDEAKAFVQDQKEDYSFFDIFCLDEKEILHYHIKPRGSGEPEVYRIESTGAFKK